MIRMAILFFVTIIWQVNADDVSADIAPAPYVNATPDTSPAPETPSVDDNDIPSPIAPQISVSTSNPLDLNWTGALELAAPDARPAGVVLPFLKEYPIENLEIKLRLLNWRF